MFQKHKVPSGAVLLARHAPVVVLHPDERSAPTNVEGFLADADLVGGRYDLRDCSARDGLAALQCYDDADEPAAPVVYGAVFRTNGRIALQYWLFHAFDLWSPFVPQSADYWKLHEGDWEAVTVLLDATGRPTEVGASRHCGGARRAWAKVERRGSRPVVYAALGSHALYFRAGRYLQQKRCWPKEALAVYDAYKVAVVDHAAAGRTASPRVVPVSAELAGLDALPWQLRREPVPALPAGDVRLRRRPARPRVPRPLAEAVRGAAQLAGGLESARAPARARSRRRRTPAGSRARGRAARP